MTANTNPTFYQLASQISSLIFFDVPHESASNQPWESLLLQLIKTAQSKKLQNRLYSTVSRLARLVSELSASFFNFESKYRIMNVVSHLANGRTEPTGTPAEEPSRWLNSLQCAVQWPGTTQIGGCEVDDLPSLRLLRTCFTPTWNTRTIDPTWPPPDLEYFDALKTLSPSTRVIYENVALDAADAMRTLKTVYDPDLQKYKFALVRGGIVLVTAPRGWGRSAVVKLMSQHLQTQASLVVVENYPGLLGDAEHPAAFYSLMVSTLHQILCQKPSLLTRPVQLLFKEMLQRDAWAEEAVRNLLSVLFDSCDADFLIVVHDFESAHWPDVARQWWSGLVDKSNESSRSRASTCTLLASGAGLGDDDHPSGRSCLLFDLTKNYERKKDEFIRKECTRILTEIGSASSGFLRSTQGIVIQNEIVSKMLKLPVSFGEIGRYLEHTLRGVSLSNPKTILQSIHSSPETAVDFYHGEIAAVLHDMNEELLSWATAVLSWAFKSIRPLHVHELAEAVAINLNQREMAEDDAVELDIERDIRRNLGVLLNVENGRVRIASPTARTAVGAFSNSTLQLLGDEELVLRCLHFLTLALGQHPARRAAGANFVDYAVRSWPAHLLRIDQPSESLCTAVAEFLRSSPAASRWFRLYMASYDDSQPLDCLPEYECDNAQDETEDVLGLTPAEMASHTGLWPIVSHILAKNDVTTHGGDLRKISLRRGSLERYIAFLDGTGPKLYLECAIASDNVQAVIALIDELGEKIIDSYPLHLAAFMGSPKMVQMLLDRKIIPKPGRNIDEKGRNAIHMAALGGRPEILELLHQPLVEDNTNIYNQSDSNLDTPLILAMRAGNLAAARLLIDLSKRQGVRNDDTRRRSPAHCAIENCPPLLKDLLDGATARELTNEDQRGQTLLHNAARSGCIEAVKAILEALLMLVETKPRVMQSESTIFLNHVSEMVSVFTRGSTSASITPDELRQFVLPRGLQDLPDRAGYSALLLYPIAHGRIRRDSEAADIGEDVLLNRVLGLNALLHRSSESSYSDFWMAHLPRRRMRKDNIRAKILVQHFLREDPLTLERAILATDSDGKLPIHHAAEIGQREVLELLIQRLDESRAGWGDLMRKHRDARGNTPGDLAARKGHSNVLEALFPGETRIDDSLLASAADAG